jgi:two-component system, NtrC family, response regulator GlrR
MQSAVVQSQATQAADARKPIVAVLCEPQEIGISRELAGKLSTVFTCSASCATCTPVSKTDCDAQLVIWQCASTPPFLRSDVITALARTCEAFPVIVIAESLNAIGIDVLGGRVADFVVRPYTCEELILRAQRVLGVLHPVARAWDLSRDRKLDTIVIGQSAALTNEVEKLKRFAACDAGVLILGETGTGKEVFAQAIHYASARAAKPMVAINCGAVPAELMEAELFGHVKGAYTNAHISRTGLVHEAEHGTLFLDDVDCLTASAQAKLLRFLQEREYRVVGSNTVHHADVRVIAASNRDLAAMARQGQFRQDLFYRLNVLTLSLPPLRERKEDIAVLGEHFLRQFAQRYNRPACRPSPGALLKLLSYDWPGNVRELGHVLERAMLLSSGGSLEASDVDLPVPGAAPSAMESFQAMKARIVQSFERSYIESILGSTGGNVTEAARVAGKNRRALFELIRKHEISPASFRAAGVQ